MNDKDRILTSSSTGLSRGNSDGNRSKSYPARIVSQSHPHPAPNFLIRSSVPPNCRFEVDDAEDDWTFTELFDYIHARAVVTCFKDNRTMLQKIYDNLAPGGYFELQDPCLPMLCDDGTLDGTSLGE